MSGPSSESAALSLLNMTKGSSGDPKSTLGIKREPEPSKGEDGNGKNGKEREQIAAPLPSGTNTTGTVKGGKTTTAAAATTNNTTTNSNNNNNTSNNTSDSNNSNSNRNSNSNSNNNKATKTNKTTTTTKSNKDKLALGD